MAILRGSTPTALARRIKETIDRTFAEPVHLTELSSRLGLHQAAMTRAFKECYGVTPLLYRNLMRVTASIKRLLQPGRTVTGAAREVGFADLSRFQKNFVSQTENPPSRFLVDHPRSRSLHGLGKSSLDVLGPRHFLACAAP